jgi:hypothetical protein
MRLRPTPSVDQHFSVSETVNPAGYEYPKDLAEVMNQIVRVPESDQTVAECHADTVLGERNTFSVRD